MPLGDALLVAGWRAGAAQHDVFFVARLDASGALDPSFGTRGVADANFGVGGRAAAMAVDGAGRIVLAGSAGSQHAPARFDPNDTFDGATGEVTFGAGELNAVAVDGVRQDHGRRRLEPLRVRRPPALERAR